jgi:hypothetical protein
MRSCCVPACPNRAIPLHRHCGTCARRIRQYGDPWTISQRRRGDRTPVPCATAGCRERSALRRRCAACTMYKYRHGDYPPLAVVTRRYGGRS